MEYVCRWIHALVQRTVKNNEKDWRDDDAEQDR